MRKIAVVLAFVSLPLFAQTGDVAPCAAPIAAKITPCGQPADPTPGVIATLDGMPIRVTDLDEATQKTIAGLDSAIAAAREKASREELDDLLIAREAKRRGVSVGNLLYSEVMSKTPHPTDQDVAAEIASHPERYRRGSEDSEFAAGILFDRRLAEHERDFVAGLEKKFQVQYTPGAHVDTAVADERIRVMKAQKDAVDRVIRDRLLAAEAVRRGVSPPEVTRAEVAAKITPATDAELKEYWQRYQWYFGDDFAKAREQVTEMVQSDKAQAAEKAFEARLREGHAVLLMFQVPTRPVQDVIDPAAPAKGAKNAPVTLVEWGDFECPPCGAMSRIVDEALQPYGDRVRYVFRQCPLSMHPYAWKAAEAAMAAQAQGKFFEYAHILFANQKALDVASLKKYGRDAGLDGKRFDADLDSGRFAGDVLADKRIALRSGVHGTPGFFINGIKAGEEVFSVSGMRAAIDAAAPKQQ